MLRFLLSISKCVLSRKLSLCTNVSGTLLTQTRRTEWLLVQMSDALFGLIFVDRQEDAQSEEFNEWTNEFWWTTATCVKALHTCFSVSCSTGMCSKLAIRRNTKPKKTNMPMDDRALRNCTFILICVVNLWCWKARFCNKFTGMLGVSTFARNEECPAILCSFETIDYFYWHHWFICASLPGRKMPSWSIARHRSTCDEMLG